MFNIKCRKIIEEIYEHYQLFIKEEDDNSSVLIDPVDQCVIGFHYGETHLGVAFMIYGLDSGNNDITSCGEKLIQGFITHAREYQKEIAYHWDFNNFALCCLVEYLEKKQYSVEFCKKVKAFVLEQKDSNNETINWQPMRIFVNQKKYEWTNNKQFLDVIEKSKAKIIAAHYEDGFFEDLLPKGVSFNFQYHLYTTAVLAFLKLRGMEICEIDKAIAQATAIMDPQGDINYLGRGNNQIFAWGPAIYLYQLLDNLQYRNQAMEYVYHRSLQAIENNNLILNDYTGNEKIWWWDYHYCSVYIAHYAFWIALTLIEERKLNIPFNPIQTKDSGVHIHNGKHYVVTFDGRKHYLAESGKIIVNITSQSGKNYFKGAFGPYYKQYGFKYGRPIATIHNFIGLMKQKNWFGYLCQKPLYPEEITVLEDCDETIIKMNFGKQKNNVVVNLPWFDKKIPTVEDSKGNIIKLYGNMVFDGPYGKLTVYQSRTIRVNAIIIRIKECEDENSIY